MSRELDRRVGPLMEELVIRSRIGWFDMIALLNEAVYFDNLPEKVKSCIEEIEAEMSTNHVGWNHIHA